jgi:hypothetical protein
MTKFGFNLLPLLVSTLFVNSSPAAKQSLQADNPEQLYTKQPTVTPELSSFEKDTVGVQTIAATNPDQFSAKDFDRKMDSPLTLEVWYPSQELNAAVATSYENVTRSGQAIDLQGNAHRHLAARGSSKVMGQEPTGGFLRVVTIGSCGALNKVAACDSFSVKMLPGFGMPAQAVGRLLPIFNSCNAGRNVPDRRWQALLAFATWGGESACAYLPVGLSIPQTKQAGGRLSKASLDLETAGAAA